MTARTGMTALISELRGLTEAGLAEWTIVGSAGTSTYWDDDQLQNILDINRQDLFFDALDVFPYQMAAGSLSYQDYRSNKGFFEATTGGTAVLFLQDSTGATVGTANYTPDYRRGTFLFNTSQGGTAYYLTARSYDLNASAADVWRKKAAHYSATSFDFSTDNHSVSRSQVYQHCLEMAAHFEGMSSDSVQTIPMFRGDM